MQLFVECIIVMMVVCFSSLQSVKQKINLHFPIDTSYLLLSLSQWKDPSARAPQHRAESCQASTWKLDLISHVLSNYVLQKKDVNSLPTFGVQMKTA